MKNIFALWIIWLVVILGCISKVLASSDQRFLVTLGEGYDWFAKSRQIDNTDVPFIASSYFFSPSVSLEGMLGIFITRSHLPINNDEQVNGALLMIDVFYHFLPTSLVSPYVMAGPGLLSMRPNGTNADTLGILNAGLGLEWPLSTWFSLRAEGRDVYTVSSSKQDIVGDLSANIRF